MSKPGWGAVLVGEPADLDDWTFQLKEAFDPWVEVHNTETILRSASLDELTTAGDVRDRAIVLIERLNGALALSEQTKPLRIGGVIQVAPDGRLHRTLFAEGGVYRILGGRAKLRATLTLTGPGGEPLPPPPPQPSQVQNWAAVAESEELLDDALIYFGRVAASSAKDPEFDGLVRRLQGARMPDPPVR